MSFRIGIFGGTFDPVHKGHLRALENFIKEVSPDLTLLIPAGIPPHKQGSTTPIKDRVNMLRAATRDFPNTEICLYEAEKADKCYSVDTLRYLRGIYPNGDFVMFVGSDMLMSFDRWFKADEIAKLTELAVFSRNGDDLELLRSRISEMEKTIGLRASLYVNEPTEISSTEIRNSFAMGTFPLLIPPETAFYIKAKGLYGAEKCYDKALLAEVLRKRLNPGRLEHVFGVAQTAERLSGIYGEDCEKACLAGLLHDCTKDYPYDMQLRLVKEFGLKGTKDDLAEPIIHSLTALGSARDDFGITDPRILSAVRNHTVGRINMTMLEKIIYTADFIEPTRNYSDVDFYREKAEENIDEAIFLQIKWLLRVNTEKNRFIHPGSVKIYNSMLENERIKKGK